MNRRTLAIALIVFGVAAVIGVLIWTFYPSYQQYRAAQPPPVKTTTPAPQFTAPQIVGNQPIPGPQLRANSSTQSASEADEEQAREALRRMTRDFVSRLGSISNLDEFGSIKSVYTQVTPATKAYLESWRADLIKLHPQTTNWGQTTKAVSANITDGLPIKSSTKATVQVQAQVITTADQTQSVSYSQTTLELMKQGDQWLVSHVTSTPWTPSP